MSDPNSGSAPGSPPAPPAYRAPQAHAAPPAYAAQPVYRPQQSYPAQPSYPAQAAYPVQPGYLVPYAPLPPKLPLTPAQRAGAMLAGGIGFTLFIFGGSIVFMLVALALIVGIFAAIWTIIGMNSPSVSGTTAEVTAFLDTIPVGLIVILAIVALLIALALMVAGILISIRIMKKRGVDRPVAITMSGLGIGLVAYWIVSSVLGFASSMISTLAGSGFDVVAGLFSLVLGIVLLVAIGVFVWWWMAQAWRERPSLVSR